MNNKLQTAAEHYAICSLSRPNIKHHAYVYRCLWADATAAELASIENNGSAVLIKELGIKVRTLTDEDKSRLDLAKTLQGVIISEINNDSLLIRQNIKKDDIIIEIQNRSVEASGEVLQIIDEVISQGKENVLIVFYSGPNSNKYIGARLSLD